MDIVSVYFDVMDNVKEEQNGPLTISSFNIKSKIAELTLLDYLSSDVEGLKPPTPYDNSKVRSWISYFLKTVKRVVENGELLKEPDYYMDESLAIIGSYKDEQCGDEIIISGCDTPIEILNSEVFDYRCQTYIKSLRPSIVKPIAKIVGDHYVFNPPDLGSVKNTYKRLPVFGEVKVEIDSVYNNEIPSVANSIPYEWPEYARRLLVWFISQQYAVGNRERALTEQLQLEGKSVRG